MRQRNPRLAADRSRVVYAPDPPAHSGLPMPRLSANLSFLFNEVPFLDRFGEAARAGFRAVEFAFAYDVPRARDRRAPRPSTLSSAC